MNGEESANPKIRVSSASSGWALGSAQGLGWEELRGQNWCGRGSCYPGSIG